MRVTPVQDASTNEYPFEIDKTNIFETLEGPIDPGMGKSSQVCFTLDTREDVASGYVKINFDFFIK